MIHNIAPHVYHPEYKSKAPAADDYLLLFTEDQICLPTDSRSVPFLPTFKECAALWGPSYTHESLAGKAEYLFAIDNRSFYRLYSPQAPGEAFSPSIFREFQPRHLAFAGTTAFHIHHFRLDRRFCGRCGHPMSPSQKERSMICPSCGNTEYPKIAPAIITAIVDGDRMLLTRYARGGYRHWGLVAGFVEVGETFKAALRREVMEEVGLRVDLIRYYKSQPWSFSQTAMVGFFSRLKGSPRITLDTEELAEARWFARADIPLPPHDISIGQEMILRFKNGYDPFSE